MKKIFIIISYCLLMLFPSTVLSAPTNEDLINAATLGDIAKVGAMLKDGANPNAQNAYGWTPLLAASAGIHLDIAVVLMDAGANPNVASHTGETPLLYAVMTRSTSLINALIERGADPNKKSTMGLSPASLAKTYGINIPSKMDSTYNVPPENTTLTILNNESMQNAKIECISVGKYDNDSLNQFAYVIDDKIFDTIYGMYSYNISVITPYSLAKYGYYKEKQIFRDFTPNDQKILLDNNGIAFILVSNMFPNTYAPPINNLVIKKNGTVYKPINANMSLINQWGIGGNIYAFPIGLFSSKDEMEIVLIGIRDDVKTVKLTTKKLDKIK